MLDINLIREQPDLIRQTLRKRQMDNSVVDQVLERDQEHRVLIQEVENLKAERNVVSKEIGRTQDQDERQVMIEAARQVGDKIAALDTQLREVEAQLDSLMVELPNVVDERVPFGVDESENVVIKTVGEIPEYEFEPKAHWDLGPELGIINFEQGVKITGSRFYVLSGAGARLQRALIAYMLDLHTRQGYTEKYTPFMVRGETMYGAGEYAQVQSQYVQGL